MKRILILSFPFILIFFSVNAQIIEKNKLIYRLGAGPSIEGNLGLFGANLMNEISYFVTPRFSINPSLTYFVSVEDAKLNGNNSSKMDGENVNSFASSLFTDVRFQYDVIRTKKDLRVGVGFGPSFQLGGESVHGGWWLNESGGYDSRWNVKRHARLGYVTQVTFDWQGKNINRRNTLGVSMSSFDGYWPYYLMLNYRLGFKL